MTLTGDWDIQIGDVLCFEDVLGSRYCRVEEYVSSDGIMSWRLSPSYADSALTILFQPPTLLGGIPALPSTETP